jgi:hypothetical protein
MRGKSRAQSDWELQTGEVKRSPVVHKFSQVIKYLNYSLISSEPTQSAFIEKSAKIGNVLLGTQAFSAGI